MGPAALPGRAGQRRADRRDQPGMGIGDDQLHSAEATGDQTAQKRQPPHTILG
jgi:hypothetical protein